MNDTPSISLNAAAPPAAKRKNRWWIRALVSGFILGWLVERTQWQPLLECLGGINLAAFAAALGLFILAQVVSSVRWRLLAESLGFQHTLRQYVELYFVGMFFNLFLPTSMGGDVVRAWNLAESRSRRIKALWSVFSERLSGLIALVVLAVLATFFPHGPLPPWASWLVWSLAVGLVGGFAALPWLGRLSPKLRTVAESLSFCSDHRSRWLVALGISFVVQVLSTAQIILVGVALHLDVPWLGMAVVVPLVTLLTMLPISLNGVGIREGSLLLLLAPYGVTQPQAVALGLAWLGLTLVMGLLGGLVFLAVGTGGSAAPSRITAAPVRGLNHPLRENATHGTLRGGADQGRAGKHSAAA